MFTILESESKFCVFLLLVFVLENMYFEKVAVGYKSLLSDGQSCNIIKVKTQVSGYNFLIKKKKKDF